MSHAAQATTRFTTTPEEPDGTKLEESRGQSLAGAASNGKTVNVGRTERTASVAAGIVLTMWGASRLTTLKGWAAALAGGAMAYRGISGRCGLYKTLGLSTASQKDSNGAKPEDYFSRGIQIRRSQTICKTAAELYEFWHDFSNLPKFMTHLKRVSVLDDKNSRWATKGPFGAEFEWNAEIINDEPNRVIAWRSTADSEVDNSGSVRFVESPDLGATEVIITIDYIPPAGKAGALLAKLFGEDPEQQIAGDLRRFKQLMEAGEIATTDGQPRGVCR